MRFESLVKWPVKYKAQTSIKTVNMKKRNKFLRVAYSNPPGDNKQPRLHQIRDGAAFCELAEGLRRPGFEYGTILHFYPAHGLKAEAFRFLNLGDLPVLTTRPPVHDYLGDPRNKGADRDRRLIARSDNDLEKAIFASITPFFSWVSRYFVELSEDMASKLPDKRRNMANLEFHSYRKGTIRSKSFAGGEHAHYRHVPKKDQHAVGYFLHLPKIKDYPCGMILSFSMGGYENLAWNRIVRLRFNGWLRKPVFAFAELELPAEPVQPLTPEFADDAPATVLIEHAL
jgi:hypothetical protein